MVEYFLVADVRADLGPAHLFLLKQAQGLDEVGFDALDRHRRLAEIIIDEQHQVFDVLRLVQGRGLRVRARGAVHQPIPGARALTALAALVGCIFDAAGMYASVPYMLRTRAAHPLSVTQDTHKEQVFGGFPPT